MISIDVQKPEVKVKEAEKSLSQQKRLRDADKKMSVEKYERLKRAGIVK
jgi:hypothetical protein